MREPKPELAYRRPQSAWARGSSIAPPLESTYATKNFSSSVGSLHIQRLPSPHHLTRTASLGFAVPSAHRPATSSIISPVVKAGAPAKEIKDVKGRRATLQSLMRHNSQLSNSMAQLTAQHKVLSQDAAGMREACSRKMDNAARILACDSMLDAVSNERDMLQARLREVEHLLQDVKHEAALQREGLLRERADSLKRSQNKHEYTLKVRDDTLASLRRDHEAMAAELKDVLRERDAARHKCDAVRRERDEARDSCAAMEQLMEQRISHMQDQLAARAPEQTAAGDPGAAA